jgi:hypothetical protein
MESPTSTADELPAIYRAILDGLAPLEQTAHRPEALRIRSQASSIYAQSWSDDGRKALQRLLRRIERMAARQARAAASGGTSAGRQRWPLRRPFTAR